MNFYLHKVIISLVGGTFLSLNVTMKCYGKAFDKAKVSVLAATVKLGGFSTCSSSSFLLTEKASLTKKNAFYSEWGRN